MKNSKLQLKIQKFKKLKPTFNFKLITSNHWRSQSGQALITLLFFTIVAVTITSAAVVVILTNSLAVQKLETGTTTYYSAESGAENAVLRLIRDPSYTGETMTIGGATVVSTVSESGGIYTINSTASYLNFERTVEITATYISNVLTITDWKEVF